MPEVLNERVRIKRKTQVFSNEKPGFSSQCERSQSLSLVITKTSSVLTEDNMEKLVTIWEFYSHIPGI